MKECNVCQSECHPSGRLLMSNLPCNKVVVKRRTWKFTDLVSKVTISNPESPVINMLKKAEGIE